MKKLLLPVILFVLLILSGCVKDDGVCVSSTGKVITEDRGTVPFHSVLVYDNINLILTQDTSMNRIMVEAGKNLIGGITTVIDSGNLVIRNENKCNWLRRFDIPINVYLTFSRLDTISFRAAGDVTCTNTWTNHTIYFDIIEGSGKIDLDVQAYETFIMGRYGTTNINVTGTTEVATLISYIYGPLHAENLVSKFTYVSSYSPNDVFVYSSIDLAVEIGNIGNVYYRGDPSSITTNFYSSGRLFRIE